VQGPAFGIHLATGEGFSFHKKPVAFVMRSLYLLLLLVVAAPVAAAEIGPCGELDRISLLVGQTRSFSGGKVKIAEIDTDGEPVCCSSHLLVFIPDLDGGSRCFALSDKAARGESSARGFSGIGFGKIAASYDAGSGLLLTVPYTLYAGGGPSHPRTTRVRIDLRGDGLVTVER
jgi:hypothetical protein